MCPLYVTVLFHYFHIIAGFVLHDIFSQDEMSEPSLKDSQISDKDLKIYVLKKNKLLIMLIKSMKILINKNEIRSLAKCGIIEVILQFIL